MMSFREFVEKLDRAGQLVRIKHECDPKLEIAAIADPAVQLLHRSPARPPRRNPRWQWWRGEPPTRTSPK